VDSVRECDCAIGVVAAGPMSGAAGGCCRGSSIATFGPRRPPAIGAIVVVLRNENKLVYLYVKNKLIELTNEYDDYNE